MQLNFIANESVPSMAGQTLDVIDPSDGQVFDQIQRSQAGDIDQAVTAARAAFNGPWGRLTAVERGRLLMALSRKVGEHAAELAALEQRDCGKPTKQAAADAVALARYFEFYAGSCDKLHGETLPYQNGYSVLTWREPHGVTGHIVPWNYPMQIIGRSVGAALAMGNACVLKPAEEACLTALAFAQLAAESGLPAGAHVAVDAHAVQRPRVKIERSSLQIKHVPTGYRRPCVASGFGAAFGSGFESRFFAGAGAGPISSDFTRALSTFSLCTARMCASKCFLQR